MGDLLGVEERGAELDLRTLHEAVSLARGETSGTSPGGRRADDAVGRRHLIARLEEALGVYRGTFMEGFSLGDAPEFELWLEAERARWREAFGELCEGVSRLQAEAGRLEDATETTRLWARHAPLEEAAHLRLAELLSAVGDSEGALLAFEQFRGLSRELGTELSPRLMELAERLREEVAKRATLGTSLTRSAATNPFSALEVSFAGRQEEFRTLVSEYHACGSGGETRVVALMGEAGIGKTRLAKEFLGWAGAQGADVLEGGGLGRRRGALRAAGGGREAPPGKREGTRRPPGGRLARRAQQALAGAQGEVPRPSGPGLRRGGETAKGALFEAIARTVGALAAAPRGALP
jgi:hypothetical protein